MKANTNVNPPKSDRSLLLGVKRAPSDFDLMVDKNLMTSYVKLDLSGSQKRMKLNDDSLLKESAKAKSKPSNSAMIKAIDSDDAFDYLRVRKQNGVSKNKLNIKKATIFDKVAPESEEGPSNELALDPF